MSKADRDFEDGIQFMKIPNFSIALKPFDPETYEEDEDDDQIEEGRNRLKLKNTRWRFAHDADGKSLVIGKERFDVESMPITATCNIYLFDKGPVSTQKISDRKLISRPHSTDSETHKKFIMCMGERTTRKSSQVWMVAEVGANPEQARREAVRREEEAFRAALRKEFDAPLIGASDSEDSDIGHCVYERDAEDSDEEFQRKKQQQKKKIVTSDE